MFVADDNVAEYVNNYLYSTISDDSFNAITKLRRVLKIQILISLR